MKHASVRHSSFSAVIRATFALLIERRESVLLSTLSFGLLLGVFATVIEGRISGIGDVVTTKEGIVWSQLHQKIDERLRSFSDEDMTSLLQSVAASVRLKPSPAIPSEDFVLQFIVDIAPWILLSMLLNAVTLFVLYVFFFLLGSRRLDSAYDVSKALPFMSLRTVPFALWFFVLSLIWIPLVGPILALLIIPRIIFAPVFFIRGKGIALSFRESAKATRGHYCSVLLSMIGLLLFSILILWFFLVLVAILASFSTKLSFLLWLFSVIFCIAFQTFFVTRLTDAFA